MGRIEDRIDGRHLLRRFGPVALAVVPIAVAGLRAAAGSWVPIEDNPYFTARSMDVGTKHHPLLGAWSSGSNSIDMSVNNLGPLQLDLLAPFTRVAPIGGTAIGVAAVHAASVVTIGWIVARLLGVRYVLPAMVGVSLLAMTLGSELLITPQQHQYLVIPYLVVLVAAWAVTAGDRWSLIPLVFFASLVVQTHLSYPILIAALGVPTLVGLVVDHRRPPDTTNSTKTRYMPQYVLAGLVGVVLWIQPLIDQFWFRGNLGRVLDSGGEGSGPSIELSFRLVADVLVSPGGYVRPGYRKYDPQGSNGADVQLVGLVLLLVGLFGAAAVFARRGRRRPAAGLAVAAVACTAAVVNTVSLPVPSFGLQAENLRSLWSTCGLLAIGAFCAVQRWLPIRWSRAGNAMWLVLLVAIVAVNIPRSIQNERSSEYAIITQSASELVEQMNTASISGPIVIANDNYFANAYKYLIVTVLNTKDVDYRFESPEQEYRFGEDRMADGTEPRRLLQYHGPEADRHSADPGLLAYVDGTYAIAVVLEENDPSATAEGS